MLFFCFVLCLLLIHEVLSLCVSSCRLIRIFADIYRISITLLTFWSRDGGVCAFACLCACVCAQQAECWLRIKGPFPRALPESVWCRITLFILPLPQVFLCHSSLTLPALLPFSPSPLPHFQSTEYPLLVFFFFFQRMISVFISHLSSKTPSPLLPLRDQLPVNKAKCSDMKGYSQQMCMCVCVRCLCTVHMHL